MACWLRPSRPSSQSYRRLTNLFSTDGVFSRSVTVNFKAVTPPLNLTYPNTSDPTPSIIFALDDMARSPASQHSPLPFVHLKYTVVSLLII